MVKWEYKVISLWGDAESTLNTAGAQGWELVGIMPRGRESYPSGFMKREVSSSTTAATHTPTPTPAPGISIKL